LRLPAEGIRGTAAKRARKAGGAFDIRRKRGREEERKRGREEERKS
jgi:hypothetical protein